MKPLDIVVGLKAHLWSEAEPWSFERLAASLGVSASQAHTSLHRMEAGHLYRRADRSLRTHTFSAFAAHGIPVVFPAEPGAVGLGMPTAHAGPPLSARLVGADPYVWPMADGALGRAIRPLHPSVPMAAAADSNLYAALALIDALRVGRARDRGLALEELESLLGKPERDTAWLSRRREARS